MIYIFTHSYPYTRCGEVFLGSEIRFAQAMGLADSICLVPLRHEKGTVSVCPVVRSEPCLLSVSNVPSLWRLVRL